MLIDGTIRVTKGGSICADILYSDGWTPQFTIDPVLRNIIISISTADGSRNGPVKVDPNRLSQNYLYDDYRFSYNEVAGFHGFKSI
jgi:ubiquitin-protein ligase